MATLLDRESPRKFLTHAQLTVSKISASASETRIPFIPIMTAKQQRRQEKKMYRLYTSSTGEERNILTRWELGSGVLVEAFPYIVPRSWLHEIRPDTCVELTYASQQLLMKVFENRHLVAADVEFEGSHFIEKAWVGRSH